MKFKIDQPMFLNEQGKRQNNEDSIFPAPENATSADRLFLVCDGVGGSEKGEIASKMVCETFSQSLLSRTESNPQKDFFEKAVLDAEAAMSAHIKKLPSCNGMKTTLTYLWLRAEGAYIGWVGDSRIYHFRNGKIIYRSEDHSLVNEMVKRGEITEEEAQWHPHSNLILRAVAGQHEPTELDLLQISDIQPGDIFMLCTDGVTENLTETNLAELSSLGDLEMMKEQIQIFCEDFSKDNYSLYLIKIDEVEQSKPEAVGTNNKSGSDSAGSESDTQSNLREENQTELKEDKKETVKSGNNLVKYMVAGLGLIGLFIGSFIFYNKQKENAAFERVNGFVSKSVFHEQQGNLDSAMHYLELADAEKVAGNDIKAKIFDLDNKENELARQDSLKVVNAYRDSISRSFNEQISTIGSDINFIKADDLISSKDKERKIVALEYQREIIEAKKQLQLGELELSFDLLHKIRKDSFAIQFLDKEAWLILGKLVPSFVKNDSIRKVEVAFCREMANNL